MARRSSRITSMTTLEQLEARVAALEGRVRAAEDVAAIVNLKSRYGRLADSRYTLAGVKSESELDAIAREVAALFS